MASHMESIIFVTRSKIGSHIFFLFNVCCEGTSNFCYSRYRFEEARPGVIDVRPKFRYKIQKSLDDKECSSSCEVQMFNNVKFIKIMTIDLVSEVCG
jgi:hypothetical protein